MSIVDGTTDSLEEWPFDKPEYLEISQARQEALGEFLDDLQRTCIVRSALDVGTGIGLFAGYLRTRGLDVRGVDVRAENIQEARRRYPDVSFNVADVEDPAGSQLPPADLVVCVGLLYHLENPFQALRNLAAITRICLYIETMIVSDRRPVALLCDEGRSASQGRHYVAFIPSESCVVKMLYRSGFTRVYAPRPPRHREFTASLTRWRRRMVLVAARRPLAVPGLRLLHEPRSHKPSPYRWNLSWLRRGLDFTRKGGLAASRY